MLLTILAGSHLGSKDALGEHQIINLGQLGREVLCDAAHALHESRLALYKLMFRAWRGRLWEGRDNAFRGYKHLSIDISVGSRMAHLRDSARI